MVRAGEVEHGLQIAEHAEFVWNWASPAGQVRAARRAAMIADAAGLASGIAALELGCGTGLFTRTFAETGCRIVAIDVSADLLDRALIKNMPGDVRFRLEDAEQLSFPDQSFDVVIGSSVLHHLDVDRALPEIRRVLKPGGRMVFAEPNMMNPQIALQRNVSFLRRWAGESPEETAFFRWRLSDRLMAAGFDHVRVRPFDFLHPSVPRAFIGVVRRIGRTLEVVPGLCELAGSLIISARRNGTRE